MQEHIHKITAHVAVCEIAKKYTVANSAEKEPKQSVVLDRASFPDVNLRSVSGTMSTGGGAANINERASVLNMPGISQSYFSSVKAGAEERELAIKRGDFNDTVPAITVVCDGWGWSKRSHRHTYNALGGVDVMCSDRKNIGIRNKFCFTCTLAETWNIKPAPHTFFMNWTNSSQAMESDIIEGGFNKAESVHGESLPVWGCHVQKIECANHTCKCLRSSLEKLVEEKPYYKGKGGLTKRVRVRIVSAVRCANKMRSKEANKSKAIKLMNHDVRNTVHHIFGDHSRCTNFCKSKVYKSCNSKNEVSHKPKDNTELPSVEVLDEVTSEGVLEEDLEESREAINCEVSIRSDMLQDISVILDRVASKCNRLLGNFTTNMAESWMSVRAKFDGGATVDLGMPGVMSGGGAKEKLWSSLVNTGMAESSWNQVRLSFYIYTYRKSNSKKARKEYGSESLQVVPDLEKSELLQRCEEYDNSCVRLTDRQCKKIEQLTRIQSLSVTWKEERIKKTNILCFKTIVRRLIYGNFGGTSYTRTGLQSESITLKEYAEFKRKEKEEVNIEKSGLAIDLNHKHLAASPDGIYEDSRCNKKVIETGPSISGNGNKAQTRVRRRCASKFLGRRILHEWCIDEK
ncbi:hypothetical protein KUTeg_008690 [Tegillarca granosa]|uniref:Mutator-like transposase domain-containing protein n=1 Tax=Tegillarca granosa TaxID=220873 RepID=A0ABQ9F9V4_TEGGR|nr:hypothetical protein KUTeg_008690 [Tegillarca granosa]